MATTATTGAPAIAVDRLNGGYPQQKKRSAPSMTLLESANDDSCISRPTKRSVPEGTTGQPDILTSFYADNASSRMFNGAPQATPWDTASTPAGVAVLAMAAATASRSEIMKNPYNPLSDIRRKVFPMSADAGSARPRRISVADTRMRPAPSMCRVPPSLASSSMSPASPQCFDSSSPWVATILQIPFGIFESLNDVTLDGLSIHLDRLQGEIQRIQMERSPSNKSKAEATPRVSPLTSVTEEDNHSANDAKNRCHNLTPVSENMAEMSPQSEELHRRHEMLVEQKACLKCHKTGWTPSFTNCCCRHHEIQPNCMVCDDCHGPIGDVHASDAGKKPAASCDHCKQIICLHSKSCSGCSKELCSWCFRRYEHSWEECKSKCGLHCRDCKNAKFLGKSCAVCKEELCSDCTYQRCRWCTDLVCMECSPKVWTVSNKADDDGESSDEAGGSSPNGHETIQRSIWLEEDKHGPGACTPCFERARRAGYFYTHLSTSDVAVDSMVETATVGSMLIGATAN